MVKVTINMLEVTMRNHYFFFLMMLSRGAALQILILLLHKQKLESCCLFLSLTGNSIILSKIQGSSKTRSDACIDHRTES